MSDYVKANGLFGSAQRLLLAVSGGADSTALLHVMYVLKTARSLNCELLCAHLNHQLRASEADLDEEYVTTRAAKLNVPLMIERLDVREYSRREKLSIETAARKLRISALSRIAKDNDCQAVVTAHQQKDNAETIIQRLARGTGFRGLAGIWPARIFDDGTKFISPLLCVGRDEIIAYLRERNIQWRLDRTNADCAYRRNYIRHKLLPELQPNADRSVVEQLSGLAESARRFYLSVCARADELWPDVAERADNEIALNIGLFVYESPPVKVELVRRCLAEIECGERNLTRSHYENVLQLAEQNVAARELELPGGFVVCREYENLVFGSDRKICRKQDARSATVGQAPPCDGRALTLNVPGRTRFDEYAIEATIIDADELKLERIVGGKDNRMERFSFEKIEMPLTVRFRRPGDKFVPLGMTLQKKVGKFLTDQRVPRRLREKVFVIADARKIIWVCPVRISEQTKITRKTGKILQLRIAEIGGRQKSVDAMQAG